LTNLINTNIKIVAVVHDEIVIETEWEHASEVARILKENMKKAGVEYLALE
jgi:DNA polymerase I-like protein with 3'-5' exonuclease and polymerase domains